MPKRFPDTQNLEGRGKSRGQRGWISQYLPSFGGGRTFSHHQFFYREWIRKSFPVDREGLTVLKSILPCWWWENGKSYMICVKFATFISKTDFLGKGKISQRENYYYLFKWDFLLLHQLGLISWIGVKCWELANLCKIGRNSDRIWTSALSCKKAKFCSIWWCRSLCICLWIRKDINRK